MRKICILNQKGGVGKTTTTINLGAGLSRKNRKVLLIDLDPQGNIATSFHHNSSNKDIYDFLIENADIRECIRPLGTNFDMITSKSSLHIAEIRMHRMESKESLLKRRLGESYETISKYDYVLIDCPPSIGLLSQNALLASSEVIIPTGCDYLSYKGMITVVSFVEEMAGKYDHEIEVTKIVPTMYDPKCACSDEILSQMKNEYYELISDPITINSKVREAPKFGQSIFKFASESKGAQDYQRLVNQVMYDERRYGMSIKSIPDEDIETEQNTIKTSDKFKKIGKSKKAKVKKLLKQLKAKKIKAKMRLSRALPEKKIIKKKFVAKPLPKYGSPKAKGKKAIIPVSRKKYKIQQTKSNYDYIVEFAG